MAKLTSDLMRGHSDTMILKMLKERDMYGYEIIKAIFKRSDEKYELKEVTLYASLRRLVAEECILAYWGDESKGGRRKYYSMTEKGLTQYENNHADWIYSKSIIDKLV